MPRVSDSELIRIKSEVTLERLCLRYGIELKQMGRNLVGCSPFREELEPSFIVTPEKNLWNDMGAGGEGGDTIQLVMKMEKVSFRRACEILREMLGVAPESPTLKTRLGTEHRVLLAPESLPTGDEAMAEQKLMGHVVDYYHQTFCNDPKAMGYLQKRNCFHPEAVKLFRLGYANRTLGYRVPGTTGEGKRLKNQLYRLGIFRESGHEHLSGSVVVPIFETGLDGEQTGKVCQMYGRKITDGLRKGTPDHLYLSGELRGVFNGAALANQKEILLCESLIDALTLWSAGLRNVTTIYGTRNFTPDLWAFFERVRPERVVLCFDADPAGEEAVCKYAPRLGELGATVLRAKLPKGMDINEVARVGAGNPAAALAGCIERAEVLVRVPVYGLVQVKEEPQVREVVSVEEVIEAPLPSVGAEGVGCPTPSLPPIAEEVPSGEVAHEEVPVSFLAAQMPVTKKEEPSFDGASSERSEPAVTNIEEQVFTFGERTWRARGLAKNLSFDVLKVQLRVMCGKGGVFTFHLDTLDMCNAKHRQNFVAQAAVETGYSAEILKRDLGAVLLRLEELQEALIRKTLEPVNKGVNLGNAEREAALALLRDPRLLDRLLEDFERCGIVGEATNKLVGYLAAVSRKLDEPLAIIIQSTSAAGKSSLTHNADSAPPPMRTQKGISCYEVGQA
jgi:DNA primase